MFTNYKGVMWEVAAGILSLLFPERCPGCDRIDIHGLCQTCSEQLVWLDPENCCCKCGSPAVIISQIPGAKCPDCRRQAPRYTRAVASLNYTGPLPRILTLWKYRDQQYLSEVLAELLIHWVSIRAPKWWEKIDAIIPAPHHPTTLRSRGFNPPEEIASMVARSFNIPMLQRTLFKIRNTPPQTGLNLNQRMVNLRNSMKAFDPSLIEDRTVLVIDDVMTTGATINECARALREAGAKHIYGLVLARQI